MSLVFEINKKYSLQKVTKMNCLIIKSTLKEFTEKQIRIKKPNDLLIDNKNQKFNNLTIPREDHANL